MNVYDLQQLLEDMPEDAEVRIAKQPSYPIESRIEDVVEGREGGIPAGVPAEYADDWNQCMTMAQKDALQDVARGTKTLAEVVDAERGKEPALGTSSLAEDWAPDALQEIVEALEEEG